MKYCLFLVLLLSFGATSPGVFAVEVPGLYQAEIPVASRSQKDRRQALSQLLARVLVKVSGRSSASTWPGLREALGHATSYLREYRYQTLPAMGSGEAPLESLWARFDPAVINTLLADNGIPIWGRARPSVVLWLATQVDQRREMLGAGLGELQLALENRARERGLPLSLPLLDLEDRRALTVADIWGGFADALLDASSRYAGDAVLSGRAYPAGGGRWSIDWLLLANRESVRWSTRGEALKSTLEEGVDTATDRLAEWYGRGPQAADQGRLAMRVVGVSDLDGYARVSNYLTGLDNVQRVDVFRVALDTAWFHLQSVSDRDHLQQVIALGRTLRHQPSAESTDWTFRLMPE